MTESQDVLKRKQHGRNRDKEATDRIQKKIDSELSEISKELEPGTSLKELDKMTTEDLKLYKSDLKKRLMYFESESHVIRKSIKKIMGIINSRKPQ